MENKELKMITLTKDEADAILNELRNLSVGEILDNKTLTTAIMKLNESYNYPATAGSCDKSDTADNKIWTIQAEDKVKLIKAIRAITGWNLAESKEYVDFRIRTNQDLKLQCLEIFASKTSCTIATAKHLTNTYATITEL